MHQLYQHHLDRQRRDELILSHLYLVRHVVGKLAARLPPEVDHENLEAAGVLGLVEAATHFDPSRGVQFKTFAYFRIRGAILDELRRNSPLSQEVLKKLGRIRAAYQRLPPPVSLEALAQATGLSVDEITDALAAWRLCRMASLDAFPESPRDGALANQLADGNGRAVLSPYGSASKWDGPDHHLEQQELTQLLAQAIEALPSRERTVFLLHHLEDLRLREIAQVLQLSESRVCRLLQAAEWRIAEFLRRKEVL
ncbi:RNA polymerase sigma-D factor [bacterium HR36]|nr:RNA polymerase sigma-D factor [bacterium HR36]